MSWGYDRGLEHAAADGVARVRCYREDVWRHDIKTRLAEQLSCQKLHAELQELQMKSQVPIIVRLREDRGAQMMENERQATLSFSFSAAGLYEQYELSSEGFSRCRGAVLGNLLAAGWLCRCD